MKTKLELYLAVQAAAVETLSAKPKEVDAKITELLAPLNLVPDERNKFSQLYYSRRQAMLELKDQPLEVSVPATLAVAKK